jgi:membrane-bound lytic murein transglycosylase D
LSTFLRLAPLALPIMLLAGCAQTPTKTVRAADEATINAIYADVDRAGVRGDEGLKAYRDGDAAAATAAFAEAREMFTAAAGRCTATPGCEIERVLVAQDALIDRQTQQLLDGIASEDASGETPDTAIPGEAPGPSTTSPILRSMPEATRSLALLKGQDLRKLIAMNEPMKAALEEWLTWMRPNLLDAYENYQYMRYRMWPAYENSGMPEALLFGMLAKESGGKVHAVSRAGASGPLQFMYYTGIRYGLTRDSGFDMRFDPAAAARANAAYLNDQFRLLNNDLELALGAYNGGEGRMQRLSGGGARGFWDPRVFNALPPETRDYVPMVLAASWLFLHPSEYGLEFPVMDTTPGEIVLTQAASLNELSVCLGQAGNPRGWFRTLRNLNARFDPNERLAAGTRLDVPQAAAAAYSRTCTQGALAQISRQLHDARPPVANAKFAQAPGTGAARTHVVTRGETLSSIARKFGCSDPRVIASANRIQPPRYSIRAGQRLVVPSCRV